ncbi:EGF-like domain-containing protein [Tieghemostelium lacteum]|uniref:EGF-like domain-containing protein n=1 Tax=Tieghemostelium lacteum TaxID=361077 RepID=A0A151ZD94_TIELA|nr:EGF-like domain-containing protein [Tieghemostelium lacteum]|eukprot:KYQ91923.1 EGF-like domain-containing protein [Tieghemostelium lacteum]
MSLVKNMNYYMLFLIYIITIFNILQCNALVVEEEAAINNLMIDLSYQSQWDQTNFCESNGIECTENNEHIKGLQFLQPISPDIIMGPEFLVFTKLEYLQLVSGISLNENFWEGLYTLTNLTKLTVINSVNTATMTGVFGSGFPASLEVLSMEEFNSHIQPQLFNDNNLRILTIKRGGPAYDLPSAVTGASTIESLTLPVNGIIFQGTAFYQLSSLTLYNSIGVPFVFNSFESFNNGPLALSFNSYYDQIGLTPFPNSIFLHNNITSLKVSQGWFDLSGSQIMNFTDQPRMINLEINDKSIQNINNLVLPQSLEKLHIENELITSINFLNIFQVDGLEIEIFCKITQLPSGNYSRIKMLNVANNMITTIPPDMCAVYDFDISNNQFTTLPMCMMCSYIQLGSKVKPPVLTPPACTNVHVTNYTTNAIFSPIVGGNIFLTGENLGWTLWQSEDLQLTNVELLTPNQKFRIIVGEGVGSSAVNEISIRLPDSQQLNIPYSYYPPKFNIQSPSTQSPFTLTGANFGTNSLSQVMIASSAVTGAVIQNDKVIFSQFPGPYNYDIIFGVTVTAGDQSDTFIYDKLIADPILYQPFTGLGSPGVKIMIFHGDHLTFDKSITKLLIGGVQCQIQSMNLTTISCLYPGLIQEEMPVKLIIGTRVFTSAYQKLYTCVPITNAQCINNTLVCNQGYTGDDCSSKIIYVKPPVLNGTSPSSNTTDTTELPNGDTIAHTSLISVVEIRELSGITNEIIQSYVFENWTYTAIGENQYEYNTTFSVGHVTKSNSTNITVVVQFFPEATTLSFANTTINMNPSTLKYKITMSSYPFTSPLNKLQIIMSAQFQVQVPSDQDLCSVVEFGGDADVNNDYLRLQVNDISLYGKFIKIALLDYRPIAIENIMIDPNPQDSIIETKVAIQVPHYYDNLVMDPDFSLLVDTKSASEKTTSTCEIKSKGLSKSQLAGIIVGASVFGLVIILISVYLLYKKNITVKIHLQKVLKLK